MKQKSHSAEKVWSAPTYANKNIFGLVLVSNPRSSAYETLSQIRVNLFAEWQLEVTNYAKIEEHMVHFG